eukprot:6468357-Amphidinium_carterae.2
MSKRDRCMVCARNVSCERCEYCCGPVCPKCSVHIQRRFGAVDINCYLCAEYESVNRAHEIDVEAVGDERSRASKRCKAGASNRSATVVTSAQQCVGCEHGPGESSTASDGGVSRKRKAPAPKAVQSAGSQAAGPVVYCIRSKRRPRWKAGALTPPA